MTFTAAYASPLGPLLFAAEKEALMGCAGGLEKKAWLLRHEGAI